MSVGFSRNLQLYTLIGLGSVTTAYDMYNAEKGDRTGVLVRNTAIMVGSTYALNKAEKIADKLIEKRPIVQFYKAVSERIAKIEKPKFLKKIVKKLINPAKKASSENISEVGEVQKIIQGCFKDVFTAASAMACGALSGAFLNKLFFKKGEQKKQEKIKQAIDVHKRKQVEDMIYPKRPIEHFPRLLEDVKILQYPLTAMDALEIYSAKNADERARMTAYELIANTMVPTIFVSVGNSLTKNFTKFQKIPAVGSFLLTGLYVGHKLAVLFNNRVTPNIVESLNDISFEVTDIQKELMSEVAKFTKDRMLLNRLQKETSNR